MKSSIVLTALMACALLAGGCSTTPSSEEKKTELTRDGAKALAQLKKEDSSLEPMIAKYYGYAIYPTVAKGGLGVGGAFGRGEVFEQGALVGFSAIKQANIGLQAGGQEYTELLIFEDKKALDKFKEGKMAFSADASAVALKSGAAATAKFKEGIAVFTMPNAGLMFEASVGGQSFTFEPK